MIELVSTLDLAQALVCRLEIRAGTCRVEIRPDTYRDSSRHLPRKSNKLQASVETSLDAARTSACATMVYLVWEFQEVFAFAGFSRDS